MAILLMATFNFSIPVLTDEAATKEVLLSWYYLFANKVDDPRKLHKEIERNKKLINMVLTVKPGRVYTRLRSKIGCCWYQKSVSGV
jgi:hypothetical protein